MWSFNICWSKIMLFIHSLQEFLGPIGPLQGATQRRSGTLSAFNVGLRRPSVIISFLTFRLPSYFIVAPVTKGWVITTLLDFVLGLRYCIV